MSSTEYGLRGNGTRAPLHLLTAFTNPNGGSENRTLELFALLQTHGNVQLWSDHPPARGFSAYPIRAIHPYRGVFPVGGTLAIVGPHTGIGPWLRHAALQRTIVHANLHPYHYLYRLLETLDDFGISAPEIVYASKLMQEEIGLAGTVEASPIDLSAFRPAENRPEHLFSVGRLSRDQIFKHHREDPMLYMMLAEQGCAVRIMGGTVLHDRLRQSVSIELLAEGAVAAPDFLRQLDCFYYRTADHWCEASGRVVFEAMACGLAVVCGRRGGYAEHIRHGENGFLVGTQEEAFDCIMALKADEALRERVGRAARETVEKLYDAGYRQELIRFYLGVTPPP